MKALYSTLFALVASMPATAQIGKDIKIPGKQDSAYHAGRIYISEPPFGLTKVKKIISEIPPEPTHTAINLDEKIYGSLTLREKFTYNAIHFEFYNYILEKDPVFADEDKKIFGELPIMFGGRSWSGQQSEFFDSERDSVLKLMKEDILRKNKIGLNYKRMLVNMNATEMIPFLTDFYKKDRKDHDILTVMILILHDHNYADFNNSPIGMKLYKGYTEDHAAFIEANQANEDLVMKWAANYDEGPSQASSEYGANRKYNSVPPYGLAKVDKIVESLKKKNAVIDEEGDRRPPAKLFQSFTLREKFTYHMIYAESYSQNCDGPPTIYDQDKKIFANLPDSYSEDDWSDRQIKFFHAYKDSVIKFIKEDVTSTNRMGLNYKRVIVEINGTAIIPFLAQLYKKQRKDHDILTVLLLLMENNKYPEFIASISHKKLYDEEVAVEYYNRYLVLNTANEDLIMQRAMNFYNGLKKK